jgi:hypothetical protein
VRQAHVDACSLIHSCFEFVLGHGKKVLRMRLRCSFALGMEKYIINRAILNSQNNGWPPITIYPPLFSTVGTLQPGRGLSKNDAQDSHHFCRIALFGASNFCSLIWTSFCSAFQMAPYLR